jgi:GxxExxY protein
MLEVDDQEKRKLLQEETTCKIIGAAFEVHDQLGYWISRARLPTRTASGVASPRRNSRTGEAYSSAYKGAVVGDYDIDVLVDSCVAVEVKVAPQYDKRDEAQLLNELKATGLKVGLLINFGRNKVEYKRLVF